MHMRFDKRIAIKTDHITILNLNLAFAANILFDMGFVRGGGRTALDEKVMEMTAPTVRYVFDNAYIECVQFPPEIEEFYGYLNTQTGIHIMALLTPDAEAFRQKLCDKGIVVDELERITRKDVDYGDKQGAVVLNLVPLPDEIIPHTHIAFLQHLTPDLMYQPTRCGHLNGATRMEEAVICCSDKASADRIEEQLTALAALADNDRCQGGMGSLRLVDADTLWDEFGIRLEETGSVFAALRFGTPKLEETKRTLRLTGYRIEETEHSIRVWPPKGLGLVLDFVEI